MDCRKCGAALPDLKPGTASVCRFCETENVVPSMAPPAQRSCPRCQSQFRACRRNIAEIDVCPDCGGVFFDAGEEHVVHGVEVSLVDTLGGDWATRVGPSELLCPAHALGGPTMDLYRLNSDIATIEVDLCPGCGGLFLDPDEGEVMTRILRAAQALAADVEADARLAKFVLPPDSTSQDAAVDEFRRTKGGSFWAGLLDSLVRGKTGLDKARKDVDRSFGFD